MGTQLFPSMQHTSAHTEKQGIVHTNTTTNRPLGVSAQYKVDSSEIVGGVVYDFLRVRNADVDCVHYFGSEVTPVERLWDRSKRDNGEE